MITVNLLVSSRYLVNRKLLRARAIKFLESQSVDAVIVDVNIVGRTKIKTLNQQIGHQGTTDVLSFPQYDLHEEKFSLPPGVPRHLGDIVISFSEAVAQARKKGKLVDEQLWLYLEHGLKHLLGQHHETVFDTYNPPPKIPFSAIKQKKASTHSS
jgi:probable rRNA maturation factor